MAPLQLYSSGLIFAPQEALIRTKFSTELPHWLYRAPRVEENWSPELQTLEGHSDWVRSVAFSPDGRLLASGSDDSTKIWGPATGTLKHTINTDGTVGDIEFSKKLPNLSIHLGSINIQAWHENFSLNSSETKDRVISAVKSMGCCWWPKRGMAPSRLRGHLFSSQRWHYSTWKQDWQSLYNPSF
jgi:WD40 repeat protein